LNAQLGHFSLLLSGDAHLSQTADARGSLSVARRAGAIGIGSRVGAIELGEEFVEQLGGRFLVLCLEEVDYLRLLRDAELVKQGWFVWFRLRRVFDGGGCRVVGVAPGGGRGHRGL
jgi:hypothetical protein